MKKFIAVCLSAGLSLAVQARLADRIYVSPAGNDKHTGTIGSPLRTLDAALKKSFSVKYSYKIGII